MLLQAQPILTQWMQIHEQTKDQYSKGRVILMDPAGRKFDRLRQRVSPRRSL